MEEAKMEAIATVMRRRRLEWFGRVKEDVKLNTSEQLQK